MMARVHTSRLRFKLCFVALTSACLISCCSAQSTYHGKLGIPLRRALAEDAHDHGDHDVHSEAEAPFTTYLGSEAPVDHIREIYAASGSTKDVVSWLVDASRYILPFLIHAFVFAARNGLQVSRILCLL